MPTITFNIKYGVNTKTSFSSQDLKDKFLSGIPNDFNGQKVTDETIDFYIQSAKETLESYLGLKLDRQVIIESKDYIQDDWLQWGFINTTYPVQCAVSLKGYLGNVAQINYPKEWLSVKRTNDHRSFNRQFRLVPNGGSVTYENTSALYLGSGYPLMGWWRTNRNIPNYWELEYITGFPDDKVPTDILQAIGMIATIPILGLLSDMQIGNRGLGLGVQSKSISLDGLSQSVSSYANGSTGIFGARMKQYSDQLFGVSGKPGLLEILRDSYSAIIWGVC
jgi:hypothetical protein